MIEERRSAAAPVDAHLQPFPDRLLDGLTTPQAGSEELVATRESVGLAFVAAMQLLPPKQRAVLVLVRIEGATAVGAFFATEPLGGKLERIALVATRASGQ